MTDYGTCPECGEPMTAEDELHTWPGDGVRDCHAECCADCATDYVPCERRARPGRWVTPPRLHQVDRPAEDA